MKLCVVSKDRSTLIYRCNTTILVGCLTPRTFESSVNIYPTEKRKGSPIRVGLRDHQDKGIMNHRNVGNYLRNDKALTHTSRPEGFHSPSHA